MEDELFEVCVCVCVCVCVSTVCLGPVKVTVTGVISPRRRCEVHYGSRVVSFTIG